MPDDSLLSPYGDEPQVQGETCETASKCCSSCLATRVIRGLAAFLIIGTAGVYGAVTAKPELAEYLSFFPGMKSGQCPIAAAFGGASSCSARAESSSAACSSATSACSSASRGAILEACSQVESPENGEAVTEVVLADSVFDAGAVPVLPAGKAE